ncbi:hypothetical protein Klosneuvirus_2_236 [Klosneuvirus KNV1]|uniref:Bacteriophage T5 Orf172 DNA-binding domain-containing protein n=1 Tax=Klosneuvirus KNV1 TaxID=1977640 RepID=A0A1V0SJA0_9VIRU|nr:hypothetical protein Klosneuvirus_2_236 [Klosneuvirus KNV1]
MSKTTKNDKSGFLYIIRVHKQKEKLKYKYKIGRSIDVNNRVNTLQTANAEQLIVIRKYTCMNVVKLEKVVHDRFKECKIRGEWFLFSDNDLERCMKFAKRENRKINIECNDDLNIFKYYVETLNCETKCDLCLFKATNNSDFIEHFKSKQHQDITKQTVTPIYITLRLERLQELTNILQLKPEFDILLEYKNNKVN